MGESLSLEYQGQVSFTHLYFPKKRPRLSEHMSEISTFAHLKLKPKIPFELVLSPFILLEFDNGDRSRNRLFNELYINYLGKRLDVYVGWRMFNWGVTESRQAADFINQRDYGLNLLRPIKMGELSISARLFFDETKEHYLEFFYLPKFTPAIFPLEGSRYTNFISPIHQEISNKSDFILYSDSAGVWRPQGGVRYRLSILTNVEVGLFYFNGYSRLPTFIQRQEDRDNLYQYYTLTRKGGLTAKARFGYFGLKGEMIYNQYLNEQQPMYSILRVVEPKKVDPLFEYTGGVDFHFLPKEHASNWYATIELIMDSDANDQWMDTYRFKPYRSHVFFGTRFHPKKEPGRSVNCGGYYNVIDPGVIYHLQYTEMFSKSIMANFAFSSLSVDEKTWLIDLEKSTHFSVGFHLFF